METDFEKGIAARAVKKSRNSRPSPQALCINASDHLEKKFEKVRPQSHFKLSKSLTFSIFNFRHPLKPVFSGLLEISMPLGFEILTKWVVG
jgi:hypothetical protein